MAQFDADSARRIISPWTAALTVNKRVHSLLLILNISEVDMLYFSL